MEKTKLRIIGLVATAGLGTALYWSWPWTHEFQVAQVAEAPIQRAPQMLTVEPIGTSLQPVTRSSPSAVPALTKSKQIDALVKAGDPASLYKAYKLVRDCRNAKFLEPVALAAEASRDEGQLAGLRRRYGYQPPTVACGDIAPGQETQRLQWLEKAAEFGVHGAAHDMAMEGPTGERTDNYDNLPVSVVEAWGRKTQALFEKGVTTGDAESFGTISGWYNNVQNPSGEYEQDKAKALSYAVAWHDALLAQREQMRDGAGYLKLAIVTIAQLKAEVPREQIEPAIEAGRQLIATAKTSPYWSPQ